MAKKTSAEHTGKQTNAKTPRSDRPRTRRPKNHRGLAKAIFADRDIVTVGRELLKSKSATVKARVWETLVNYMLGELAVDESTTGHSPRTKFIWDLPGPPREKR